MMLENGDRSHVDAIDQRAAGRDRAKDSDAAVILERVAVAHGVTVEALRSASKVKALSQARQAAYAALYALRSEEPSRGARFSLPEVARLLNRSNHTSVIYGLRKHQERLVAAMTRLEHTTQDVDIEPGAERLDPSDMSQA